MIDQRALEAAHGAFLHHRDYSDARLAPCLRAAIEAYEAALWRPIKEAPRDAMLILENEDHFAEGQWDHTAQAWIWYDEQVCDPQPFRFRILPRPPEETDPPSPVSTSLAADTDEEAL